MTANQPLPSSSPGGTAPGQAQTGQPGDTATGQASSGTGPDPAPSWHQRQANRPDADVHEWAWTWAGGRNGGRGSVSWLGVLLVLLGGALFVNQVNRSIDVGSLFLLGFGLAFGAAWLVGGWKSATVPALALTALGGSGLAIDLGYLTGAGWTELALGIALLIAWALGPMQKRRRGWAMWIGLILVVYGLAQVSPRLLPGLPDAPWFGPAVLVAIGLVLLLRRRFDDGPSVRRG